MRLQDTAFPSGFSSIYLTSVFTETTRLKEAFCEFDLIGWSELMPDDVRAARIASLMKMGYEKRVLLATDTCRRSQLRANGGRGYDSLWRSFLPRLRVLGVTEGQIHSMLVDAPRALLVGT